MKEEKFRLKEVKILPQYLHRSKYDELIENFMKSGLAIAEVIGDFPRTNGGIPLTSGVHAAIRRLGLTNKMWVTVRKKKVYFVNIEKSGIKKMRSVERLRRSGAPGHGKKKLRFDDVLKGDLK
jgi:hypothetical protein